MHYDTDVDGVASKRVREGPGSYATIRRKDNFNPTRYPTRSDRLRHWTVASIIASGQKFPLPRQQSQGEISLFCWCLKGALYRQTLHNLAQAVPIAHNGLSSWSDKNNRVLPVANPRILWGILLNVGIPRIFGHFAFHG